MAKIVDVNRIKNLCKIHKQVVVVVVVNQEQINYNTTCNRNSAVAKSDSQRIQFEKKALRAATNNNLLVRAPTGT